MNSNQARKFMEAVEAAGIDKYSFNTDVTTAYYHDGKTCCVVPDYNLDGIHAFKKNNFSGAVSYFKGDNKKIAYYFSDFGDVHEVRTVGNMSQMKKFAEAMGITLTDDVINVFKWMEGSTSDLKPITGDYTFKYLTDEEYDKLTPEQKEAYDENKKQYELRKAGISGVASVSIQM